MFAASHILSYPSIGTWILLISALAADNNSPLCELQDPDGLARGQASTWKGTFVLGVWFTLPELIISE